MPIFKATYSYTALVEADSQKEVVERFDRMDLRGVLEECETGNMIGAEKLNALVEVAPHDVEHELVELGNDGTFFEEEK
jgi:hypothetical protein